MATDRQLKRGNNSAEPVPYILLAILAIAFLIRLIVALRTGIQIDESRMAFAVYTVAHSGFPKLDSDVLYLLGTPVNYLFAPLGWVFQGSDLVTAIRIGNAMLSTIAVFVVWIFVWELTNRIVVTAAVTLCAAIDPMGLYWGTIASPYASLALIALLVVYSGYRAITEPDESILRRTDVSNPVVWLTIWLVVGSFTHYAVWLFVPGIAIVSFMRWGKAIFRPRHPMRIALEVSIIAPILVWMLGSWVGPGSGSTFNPGPPSFNQIWNNLDRLRDVDFNLDLWRSLYYGSRYSQLVAFLIALTTGMIAAWFFLRKRVGDSGTIPPTTLVLILVSYWGPVAIIADGSFSPLLLGILPFGYLVIAFALQLMVPNWDMQVSRRRIRMAPSVLAAALVMLPVLVYLLQGARWQIDYRTPDPDYFEASEYIETVKQPGQAIITPFPAIAWLTMDDVNRNDIVALGGPKGGARLGSETRDLSASGNRDYYIDYWTGKQAIGTTAHLCQYLLFTSPAPLILIDTTRLDADWAFKGEFSTAITQGTQVLSQGTNGIEIRSPLPLDQWPAEAQTACGVQPGQAT
jgi:hypothetical protein